MSLEPITDETARQMRLAWFRFLDTVEPFRPDLHRYCLRLTGNLWSAEDLCQDVLLRGYAAMGRGDLHGDSSRVRNPRAYLFRIASHLWIDQARRAGREASMPPIEPPRAADAEVAASVRDAGAKLVEAASPQERAAVVLRDVFDAPLREIAEILDTTEGAVKSALRRGRSKLAEAPAPPSRIRTASPALLDRFVAAFNARDAAALTALLLETVSIEVQGVGGGRGREGVYVQASIDHARGRVEVREVAGQAVIAEISTEAGRDVLDAITRFEETDGRVSRIQDYCYAPETLAAAAAELRLAVRPVAYHQDPETLEGMIATTRTPWAETRG